MAAEPRLRRRRCSTTKEITASAVTPERSSSPSAPSKRDTNRLAWSTYPRIVEVRQSALLAQMVAVALDQQLRRRGRRAAALASPRDRGSARAAWTANPQTASPNSPPLASLRGTRPAAPRTTRPRPGLGPPSSGSAEPATARGAPPAPADSPPGAADHQSVMACLASGPLTRTRLGSNLMLHLLPGTIPVAGSLHHDHRITVQPVAAPLPIAQPTASPTLLQPHNSRPAHMTHSMW